MFAFTEQMYDAVGLGRTLPSVPCRARQGTDPELHTLHCKNCLNKPFNVPQSFKNSLPSETMETPAAGRSFKILSPFHQQFTAYCIVFIFIEESEMHLFCFHSQAFLCAKVP